MAKGTVFIIDDEQDNLDYVREIVTGAGFEARTFTDGSKALPLMEAARPAVVFLDVQMPGMNGFQVLKSIRRIRGLEKVPVVFLSAISAVTGEQYDPAKIEARYGVRPDAFVPKPIDAAEVQALLERLAGPKAGG